MDMLGYVAIVKAGNSGIQDDAENKGKIENSKIKSIIYTPDRILHSTVNSKYIKRLY
jgi:hypothetical protein